MQLCFILSALRSYLRLLDANLLILFLVRFCNRKNVLLSSSVMMIIIIIIINDDDHHYLYYDYY